MYLAFLNLAKLLFSPGLHCWNVGGKDMGTNDLGMLSVFAADDITETDPPFYHL